MFADPESAPGALTRTLDELDNQNFDLVIVGGGITGVGIAREAAAVGVRTLLVEANDYGSGTSSRSTKLIHGGLRYLAMGDFALVREAALERKILNQLAPHLAEPRWMVLPARNRLEWLKFRVGVRVYETLGAVATDDRFGSATGDLQSLEPDLNWAEFPYACVYREYLTDDARLVLATLRSAVALGAQAVNYCRADAIVRTEQGFALNLVDALSERKLQVSARCVVNAAGPWAESLLPEVSGPPRLRLSKGVHVVVPHRQLPVQNLVMIGTDDGRLLFVIPRGRHTYIGTTDTPFDGGPQTWPEVTAADVDYLLRPIARYFPKFPITPGDVVASWAGLRPLVNEPGKKPKEMSRKDEIWVDAGFISIAGGKLTGFRKMAESVMEHVYPSLGQAPVLSDLGKTEPLVGGDIADLDALVNEVQTTYQQPQMVAQRLVRLYGSEVTTMLGPNPEPISASVFAEEVHWAIVADGALTLEDIVYRRLRMAWFLPAEMEGALPAIAAVAATKLGWSPAQQQAELDACRQRLAADLSFTGH